MRGLFRPLAFFRAPPGSGVGCLGGGGDAGSLDSQVFCHGAACQLLRRYFVDIHIDLS